MRPIVAFQRYRRRASRRQYALLRGHLAYDALRCPDYLSLSLSPRSRLPFPHRDPVSRFRVRASCARYQAAASRQAGIARIYVSRRAESASYGRPMQGARASQVTVTNENTHSLVSRTRGTRHCAFLFCHPPRRSLSSFSPRITIDAAVRGEIEDTADVTMT